mmetsp:Transcript_59144/g.183367  ORF Transcript_59144/g.183367 Transcript_59144/m.183367 type:complete len:225 (+) Transcript_59144:280-954(+)
MAQQVGPSTAGKTGGSAGCIGIGAPLTCNGSLQGPCCLRRPNGAAARGRQNGYRTCHMPGPRWTGFRACLRIFFSPGGHKWQKLHATPFEQPPLKTKAHGLQVPRRCHLEPCDGTSGELRGPRGGSALSSRNTGTLPASGANLPPGEPGQLAASLLPALPSPPVGEGMRLVSVVLQPSLSALESSLCLSATTERPGGGRKPRLAASPTCAAMSVEKDRSCASLS